MKKTLMLYCALLMLISQLKAGTLHGFVREKETREPIIYGNVWIKDTNIGTTTNMKGYYVIANLQPGAYELVFRYIGYETVTITQQIPREGEIELNVDLVLESIEMEEVVVTAEKNKSELEIKPSQVSVSAPQLRMVPQVGEPDIFRALQMIPGVATLSDFSAGLYVRGGSADQNLILLDQIDVYNPNHLFGFFSTFNTDAVKSVELLKGGYPAQFGGRLSSVLNVYNKEGNREEFEGVARLSTISAGATLEGPWKHGSWMVSGRRTYVDWAAKMVDFDLPYYFYDGHAHFNWDIDKNNLASVSFYLGNDLLDLSQDGTTIKLDWGNKTFSTQWTHLFSPRLFSHFVFAGSQFRSNTGVEFDKVKFGILNQVQDLAFKGGLTWTPSTRHALDFGFENKMLKFDLNYDVVDTEYRNNYAGNYFSLYAQDSYKLSLLTILQTGVRVDHYSDGGYTRFDPRVSLKQLINDHMNVTLSVGRYHQFLNMVQSEGFSFGDMWFPVDETFEPGKADHMILGFNYDNRETFSVALEGYYKKYHNIAEYRAFRGADEPLEDQTATQNFYRGQGDAYGMDVYVRNNWGRLTGWFGYSLAWTTKQVAGYNFGLEYYPTYDRRHTFTLIEDYRLGRKWRLNMAFKYGSGQPYTEATARYLVTDPAGRQYSDVLDGQKNLYRLPDYHRLDIGIFYETHLFKKPYELYAQVINVYNHKNVWYRQWITYENPAFTKDFNMLPLVPTIGMSYYF